MAYVSPTYQQPESRDDRDRPIDDLLLSLNISRGGLGGYVAKTEVGNWFATIFKPATTTFPARLAATIQLTNTLMQGLGLALDTASDEVGVKKAIVDFKNLLGQVVGGYAHGSDDFEIPEPPGAGGTEHEGGIVASFGGATQAIRDKIAVSRQRVTPGMSGFVSPTAPPEADIRSSLGTFYSTILGRPPTEAELLPRVNDIRAGRKTLFGTRTEILGSDEAKQHALVSGTTAAPSTWTVRSTQRLQLGDLAVHYGVTTSDLNIGTDAGMAELIRRIYASPKGQTIRATGSTLFTAADSPDVIRAQQIKDATANLGTFPAPATPPPPPAVRPMPNSPFIIPPPPAPKQDDPRIAAAVEAEAQFNRGRQGRRATILTSPNSPLGNVQKPFLTKAG